MTSENRRSDARSAGVAAFFSVIIPTYNRADVLARCIDSCLAQTFDDLEVVVVDDGSSDTTVASLKARDDPRVHVVVHESNRGIDPSRHTGVAHARGEWIVTVDSDWELLPSALQRLHDIISTLPEDVRAVRGRLLWDDGRVTPTSVPEAPVDYEGRVRWVEEEGGKDAASCLHRSVLDVTPYFKDRRGAMETLFELNLASNERVLYVEDVLGREHTDAPNSWARGADRHELIPRLLAEAPDMLWMAETALDRHGQALQRYGPTQHRVLLRVASQNAFLVRDRGKGLRYGRRCLRVSKADGLIWATLVLGLLGPRAVAYGILSYRRLTRGFRA